MAQRNIVKSRKCEKCGGNKERTARELKKHAKDCTKGKK